MRRYDRRKKAVRPVPLLCLDFIKRRGPNKMGAKQIQDRADTARPRQSLD